jgi:hypothetical protein
VCMSFYIVVFVHIHSVLVELLKVHASRSLNMIYS